MQGQRVLILITLVLAAVLLASCGRTMTRPAATATATPTGTPPPEVRRAAVPTATPLPFTPSPTATPTVTPTPVLYYIQPGENLYVIANRFGVPHDLLRDVNGIDNERALQVGQELIIPLGGETGPAKPTPTFTPSPLPAAVENVYFHPSPLGELAVLGEVHNTGGADLARILVRITLFDAGDRPLASAQAYTALDILAPGQRGPFAVRFLDPPAGFTTYQAEVISAVPAYLGSAHRDLEPRGVAVDKPPHGPVRLAGRIMNVGDEEAVQVVVVATAYDRLGRVVGMRIVEPEPTTVARGGEADFALEMMTAAPMASYSVQALGRRLLAVTPEAG